MRGRSRTPFEFAATLTEIDQYGRLCAYIPTADEKSVQLLKTRLPPGDECRLPYHFLSRRGQAATGGALQVHFAWPRGSDDRAMLERHARAFLGRRVSVRVRPKPYSYVRGADGVAAAGTAMPDSTGSSSGVREQGVALTVLALTPLDEE